MISTFQIKYNSLNCLCSPKTFLKFLINYVSGQEECLRRPNCSDLIYDVRDVIKTSQTTDTFDRRFKTIELSNDKTCRYFEIIQNRGEIVFVPSGWHHQVENCENTISINHNWFNGSNVSGFIWKNLESAFKLVQVFKS